MENTTQKPDWFVKAFGNAPSLKELIVRSQAKREAEKAAQQTQPPAQGN